MPAEDNQDSTLTARMRMLIKVITGGTRQQAIFISSVSSVIEESLNFSSGCKKSIKHFQTVILPRRSNKFKTYLTQAKDYSVVFKGRIQ